MYQIQLQLLQYQAVTTYRKEVFCVIEPLPIEQVCSNTSSLKDYLQTNAFLNLVVVE